jgi:hypothetical protein
MSIRKDKAYLAGEEALINQPHTEAGSELVEVFESLVSKGGNWKLLKIDDDDSREKFLTALWVGKPIDFKTFQRRADALGKKIEKNTEVAEFAGMIPDGNQVEMFFSVFDDYRGGE